MSSSFANNPIQSISAFSTKSNAATTSTAVPFETTISVVAPVGSITGMSSVVVAQPSSSAPSIASPLSTSTANSLRPTPSLATGTTITDAHRQHGLSHGALAGIIVGSVIGGLMVLGFVCLLILRKRRSKNHRISYQNHEKSPLPMDITAVPSTPQQHFRHSYRNSAMSQNSTLRSLHSQRVTNNITPFTAPISTLTTDFSVESPSTPIIDEDFWQNSPPIGTFTIISSYTQTLDDELYIQPGDQVQVYTEYDDGWCLGINLTRGGSRGVFPQHCLGEHHQEP